MFYFCCSVFFFYFRSILTVPWIELGGSVVIECEKTGYHANIEFLTKPFYGGKKHRVTAEVFGPLDKKPFLSIAGEWNGVMDAKWADGVSCFTRKNLKISGITFWWAKLWNYTVFLLSALGSTYL